MQNFIFRTTFPASCPSSPPLCVRCSHTEVISPLPQASLPWLMTVPFLETTSPSASLVNSYSGVGALLWKPLGGSGLPWCSHRSPCPSLPLLFPRLFEISGCLSVSSIGNEFGEGRECLLLVLAFSPSTW